MIHPRSHGDCDAYLEAATVHASCLHDASMHDSSAIIERGPTVHASCLHDASMHDSSAVIEHRSACVAVGRASERLEMLTVIFPYVLETYGIFIFHFFGRGQLLKFRNAI